MDGMTQHPLNTLRPFTIPISRLTETCLGVKHLNRRPGSVSDNWYATGAAMARSGPRTAISLFRATLALSLTHIRFRPSAATRRLAFFSRH